MERKGNSSSPVTLPSRRGQTLTRNQASTDQTPARPGQASAGAVAGRWVWVSHRLHSSPGCCELSQALPTRICLS